MRNVMMSQYKKTVIAMMKMSIMNILGLHQTQLRTRFTLAPRVEQILRGFWAILTMKVCAMLINPIKKMPFR